MSGLKVLRVLLVFLLLLSVQPASYCQEAEAELKTTADALFEKEQYTDATSLYLRLLALNPRSHDYNFRYGTCLLYNSYKKQDAFKYLNYSVSDPGTDVRAYYFLGKAYHLNYQFNEAIKNYDLYKQKAGAKIKPSLELDRQIEMCQNGKRLLTTITDLIVLEKREIEISSFFGIYNLNNIGGVLLVAAAYQSKIDKKKGHVPLIHFPANSNTIYYSSYGDVDTGQKDLYMRKKLPDDTWSLPQLVMGNVNTKYDEDFPYMHPGGEYLYFSSKGHNSMGGYDVFRSKLNPENNSFGPPENMDFAVSSPDDDLFYVVDSLDQNAYFASSRQSSNGKMYVYKVRVDRVPLQLAVVKGNFNSTVNPDIKKLSILVTDYASGEKIGTFTTNEKGSYLVTLPKGGKYSYEMKVEGKPEVHKYVVNIPFSKEFRPLKQKILEENAEAGNVVRVIDLFNEEVDDPVGVLAEVIKLRSELNPNADEFDLKQLDAGKENEKILAELGFANAGPQDIVAQFEKLDNKQQEKVQNNENLVNGALANALKNLEEAEKLQEKAKTAVNKGTGAETKEEKFRQFLEAQEAMDKATGLKKEAKYLLAFADSTAKTIPEEKELLAKIEAATKEIKVAVADENTGDLKTIIERNSEAITAISAVKEASPVDALIAEKTQIKKEKATIESQKASFDKTSDQLEQELKTLTERLPTAKKKDQPGIQSTIDSKTQELGMVNEENERLTKKLAALATKENAVDDRIDFFQSVTSVNSSEKVAPAEVQQKMAQVDTKNTNTLASYINQQVTEMKKDPLLLASTEPAVEEPVSVLEEKHEAELKTRIEKTGLSPKEKEEILLEADTDFVEELNTQLEEVSELIEADPTDQKAIDRKKDLTALKAKTEEQVKEHKTAIAALNESREPAASSPEGELAMLEPDYEEAIRSAGGSTPKAVLEAENAIDTKLIARIDNELSVVKAALVTNPADKKAQSRQEALTTLKAKTEDRIEERTTEIAALTTVTEPGTATPESELSALDPNYENAILSATGNTPAATLEAKNEVDNRLLAKIETAFDNVAAELAKNPSDKQLQGRADALAELKLQVETRIEDREEEIAKLNTTPESTVFTPESELANLLPDYSEEMEAVSTNDRKSELEAKNEIDNRLITAIDSELEEVESQLLRNSENTQAQQRKLALDELKETTIQQVEARTNELTALADEAPVETAFDVVVKTLRPDYESNKKAIETKTQPGTEREIALLKEEKALLAAINQSIEKTDAQVLKNPENTGLQEKLDELRETQSIQEALVNERESDLVAMEQTKIDSQGLQAKIAPAYREPTLDNPENLSEDEKKSLVSAEEKLQASLEKRQASNNKQLNKTFDPKIAAQNKTIASLLEASESRIQVITVPAVTNSDVMALMENDLGDDAELLLNSDPASIEQAKRIITELKEYESQLTEQLNTLKSEDPSNDEEIRQKESQIAFVRKRTGKVVADLDAMENYTAIDNPGTDKTQELARLEGEEAVLKQKLASGTLSSKDERAAEKELKIVQQKKAEGEQIVLKEKVAGSQAELVKAQTELSGNDPSPLTVAIAARTKELTAAPVKGSSAAELKNQLQKEQEALSLLNATNGFAETETIYEQHGVVIETIPALNERKRRFSIEIGQLEMELGELENDPAQTAKASTLKQQQTALKAAVEQIDEMIASLEKEQKAENPLKKGLEIPVTYEDEVAIASTAGYAKVARENEQVKSTQRQLTELQREKETIRKAIAASETPEKRISLTEALVSLEAESKTIESELNNQQAALQASIENTRQDPDKVKNLLARDVTPVVPVNLASTVAPELKTGFEIVASPALTRTEKAIPVDMKLPSGLVYRVQVGAFARPIPEALFKEFTPVTGERLTNGITRYLAGYFGNRQRVLEAQKDIRALGYADAFVVAYCDGERISLAEARRLEDAGLCVPKNQDSLLMEVVENRLATLSPDSLARLRPPVKKSDYNKGPGAVVAEAVEDRQGLFFTVQVGVYNRPATAEQLRNIDPLITKRLENGQIRYSSGIFQSPESAKPKRLEAITRGITDAFITAYYKGERIPLADARKLLEENGQAILEQTFITDVASTALETARAYSAAQPVKTDKEHQPVQIVSKQEYASYPAEELSLYNTYGSFYYDAADKHIKSITYASPDALPQLNYLQENVDTLFRENEIGRTFELKLPKIVAVWDHPEMEGAFADWLLRLTVPHKGELTAEGFSLVFEEVPSENREVLMEELRSYGAVSVAAVENGY